MSEQTVPDIYEWIEIMRERARKEHDAISRIIVEAKADLTAPDPGMGGDEDD